jgi:hypothetical protein
MMRTPVTELPDYIIERNQQALAAGLTIERQDICNDKLTTWYRGTESQWRASPFCRRTKPFTRSAMPRDFHYSAPGGYGGRSEFDITVQFRGPDDYRGSISREPLPDKIEMLGDDIVLYVFGGNDIDACNQAVYVGPARQMIARGIAPREILSQSEMEVAAVGPGYYSATVWQRAILPDGRYCFVDRHDERRRQRRETARMRADVRANGIDDGRWNLNKPSQGAARWARLADLILHQFESEYSRFDANAGVFAVTTDALATIRELRSELVDAIRCADIRLTERATPAVDPGKLTAARGDSKFGAFMAAAMGEPDGPSAEQRP